MFQVGDPVEVHFKLGEAAVSMHGRLAQVARPLIAIQIAEPPVCNGAVKPGSMVVVAISGGTGVYTAEAIVQRCDLAAGHLIVAINSSFRYQQRRQHERYRCDMQVRLRVVGDPEWLSGRCMDISAGGARIYLPQQFTLRSNTIEVVFVAPDNQQAVRAVAEIVRTSKLLHDSGWEIGVRFTEMNRMEKIHFARLLQHWASLQQREPVQ
ncbi:MAG: PilZ domain-containing protein [Armatimonadota bacterium]|nr:PilZ domain-containing protein [bacterium]MDW8320636.1 PilZ domain-containing protein [Armatimonadota bacterium]